MTILDLKKDDVVYAGTTYNGGGMRSGVEYVAQFKVAKIQMYDFNGFKSIRLIYNNEAVLELSDGIYPTANDFLYGTNKIRCKVSEKEIIEHIAQKLGISYDGGLLVTWEWEDGCAVVHKFFPSYFDLLDLAIPDGCYVTKEECEKANKKTVMVRVSREYHTEVDEDDAQYLLENPDEYEWKEGDVFTSASELM